MAGSLWAQQGQKPWWYVMEQGKLFFRNGAYGSALLAFEDARRQRNAMYARMESDFIVFLSRSDVRRLGDSLERVEAFARERRQDAAVEALEELYYRVPRESLDNSAARALYELGRLKDFPDAEYWIGETYRAEGELGIAVSQFKKAYEQRSLLENPGFDTELLYKIADIQKIRQEYNDMERTLKMVLQGYTLEGTVRDTLWSEDSSFAMDAMERTLETEGINSFLQLYRYNNQVVEGAHRLLGFYYYAAGRHSRAAEHLMFAFLIQNTVILEELTRDRFDYRFTSLENLMADVRKNPLLSSYFEDSDYFKIAYYLGTSLFVENKLFSARALWEFLSVQAEAGEWRGRARSQLRSPYIEKAIELP
jgi:tetratricopeptide (TPR) repeat protein